MSKTSVSNLWQDLVFFLLKRRHKIIKQTSAQVFDSNFILYRNLISIQNNTKYSTEEWKSTINLMRNNISLFC